VRHKPVVNQPPYNVFARQIEKDVLGTCQAEGLGVVVWSPLAQGVLTGKYLGATPAGSRATNEKINKFMQKYLTPEAARVVEKLSAVARGAGLTTAQVALGWCLRRAELTSVIVGATNASQLEETAKASSLPKDVLAAVEAIVKDAPLVEAV
jgi:aryl-alcohol dehydrogenase-like predicted oxidoreductase